MGDDLLDLPVLTRAGLSAAPADARAEVRARVHWVSTARGGRGAVREFIEMVLARAGPVGRGRCANTLPATDGTLRHPFVLLALLAGLTVGKAWERYKLQDGRWIDRRRARESPHYMLGLNFLVANQIDPAIEELSTAAEAARRPARDSPDSRQPVSREGTGRPRHPGTSGAAPAAAPAQTGACERAALPRARLQAWRVRRSRARSVLGSAAAGSRATDMRCRISRSCTRSSISGPTRTRCGRSSPRATAPDQQPRHQEILAFLENEIGLAAHEARRTTPKPRDGSKRRSSSIREERSRVPEPRRRPARRRATRRGRRRHGSGWSSTSPERAYLAFSRLESTRTRS